MNLNSILISLLFIYFSNANGLLIQMSKNLDLRENNMIHFFPSNNDDDDKSRFLLWLIITIIVLI